MLWAILSDIHANLEALDACLAHARARGAQAHALLGDFVGYGADAAAVVDRVTALAGQDAVVLKGNHDDAIATREKWEKAHRMAELRKVCRHWEASRWLVQTAEVTVVDEEA